MTLKKNKIKLFHGTTLNRAEAILNTQIIFSHNDEDWLGNGAYFFIDGISSGKESAIEWAFNTYPQEEIKIIEATVSFHNRHALDLRKLEDLKIYNEARNEIIITEYSELSTRRDLSIKKRKDIRLDDTIITNKVIKRLNKKLLIHNVYIKDRKQRKLILESCYPNCTAVSLNDLSLIDNLEISTLKD